MQTNIDNPLNTSNKRTLTGKVISNKMDKTAVVLIEHKLKHSLYGKYVPKSKKYVVHDEKNEASEGDIVTIKESRPISRRKSWIILENLSNPLNNKK